MSNLTPQQQMAVDQQGGRLLVSAAAGSGKTKVLVERLFRHIGNGANVDDFLIITYTRAAAAELRGKIASELARRLSQTPDDAHLRRQLYRVYRADIRTIDAFCSALLRENVHMIAPVKEYSYTADFRIMDQQEEALLQQRVLQDALDAFYERMDEKDEQLAQTLGAGTTDRALEKLVLELHGKLQSHPRPMRWLESMKAQWQQVPTDLADSPFGQILMQDAVDTARFWAQQLRKAVEDMAGNQDVVKGFADRFLEVADKLEGFDEAAKKGWQAMGKAIPAFRNMGRTPECPEKQRAKAVLERCKGDLKVMAERFGVAEKDYLEDLQAMAPAMLALLRLTADFSQRYQEAKARLNVMDFSDQEHVAIDLLLGDDGKPTDLACRVASRYIEILVDEYQDSNEVQDCLFTAVSQNEENIFTVGDVKQSIYRFRMADPTIFLARYRTSVDAENAQPGQPRKVCLSKNFRSRKPILDAVNFVFANVMSLQAGEMDYTDDQKLYYGADYYLPRSGDDVEFHLVNAVSTPEENKDRTDEEAAFVARRIRQLLDEGYPVQEGEGFRPCRPEDIVILMRSPRARLEDFTEALTQQNIPCSGEDSASFFSAPEIAAVFAFLQIIDNPRQDVPLLAVLRSPLGGFSPDRLAQIRAGCRQGDFYDALCRDEGQDSRDFLALLDGLRGDARDMPVDALLWRLYDVCHVQALYGAMPGGVQRRRNLMAFYDFARDMAAVGKRSVFDFVTYLRELLERKKAPTLSTRQAGGGVRIMSIHKSKGLEFPIVILCDLHKAFNRKELNRPVLVHPELGLGTERVEPQRHIRYDTVSKMAVAQLLEQEFKAEEMRILYVAMTRAKEKLIMVQYMSGADKRIQKLSAVADLPVPPQAVSDAACPGDWILLPLLCTVEASRLRAWAGCGAANTGVSCGWNVKLWENGADDAPEQTEGILTDLPEAAPFDPAPLEWRYSHETATLLPTKVTATQLKGRAKDEEVQDDRPRTEFVGAFRKPRFLQEDTGLTGAEKGTAMHLVMQYMDFATPARPDAVAEAVEVLRQRHLLTPEQAEAVDCGALASFLASPLCERIRKAEKVYREYRFDLLVDAGILDPAAAGEEIMLQGVADCAFVTPEGLVIVDFKTDRIGPEALPERTAYYRPQLEAYALALGRVLEMPVCGKILYYFHTNTAVEL